MNQFQRLAGIIALSFSASAMAADAPQTYADPKDMSYAEKQTLAQTVGWRYCTSRKAKEADADGAAIAKLRADAAADVTRKALIERGWTAEDAQRMVDAIKDSDARRFSMVIAAKVDVGNECFRELNVTQEDLVTRLEDVRRKYGPEIDSHESIKRLIPGIKPN